MSSEPGASERLPAMGVASLLYVPVVARNGREADAPDASTLDADC
jgi:hypothetical protein